MPEHTGDLIPQQTDGNDSFFILRDCRELFQRRLADIVRLSGITSPHVIEAFTREIGKAHDELVSADQKDGFEQTAGLTASRISLVGNDQLELDIRIGELANHLKDNNLIDHWRVQLRYMTLLNLPNMSAENNPLGFDPISRGLFLICGESENALEKNLDLLDKLEELLQTRLPEVYIELNNLLERHHVEPARAQLSRRVGSERPSGTALSDTERTPTPEGANALSALQTTLQKQFGANNHAPLDATPETTSGGNANFTLSTSAMVMLNHLVERLNALETQQSSGATSNLASAGAIQPPLRVIKAKDLDLPLGQPTAIAMDTLSLIFEAIFSTPDLPDAVKAAIGRLQIPLLKVALLDDTFFSDTRHPARQLVNRIARAAAGLSQDSSREHPVCLSLGKLADTVRSSLEKGDDQLSAHLAELESLIADRDQLIQANAQAYIQLVIEHETLEASRLAAQTWLKKTLSKVSEPAISRFLSVHWFSAMQAACLEGGATGVRWRESETIIDELLSSFEPKQTPEERKLQLSRIPALLKRINSVLDHAEVPSEDRKSFLDACFQLQTASMRNRSDQLASKLTAPPSVEPLIAPIFPNAAKTIAPHVVQILEQNGKLVQYLGLPTETQSPWRKSNSKLYKVGDWINFTLPDGETLCGRHCWEGSPSGTLVLFNSDWGYAVALAPSSLEQQLRNGQARITSEQSLFDEAARQALRQITPSQLPPGENRRPTD